MQLDDLEDAIEVDVDCIADGTDVIVGTPFDRAIIVTYGKRASEMRSYL